MAHLNSSELTVPTSLLGGLIFRADFNQGSLLHLAFPDARADLEVNI